MAKLLTTIPGIGYYSALFLVSEINDVNRFPDSYHLCSYAGLVPSTHSSGRALPLLYIVAVEKPDTVIIMAFVLPCLSPKLPNRAPPTGLITKVTVNVANIASRLSVGSFDGKKN
jgi:Transposase IS116/IS110/IS902 family